MKQEIYTCEMGVQCIYGTFTCGSMHLWYTQFVVQLHLWYIWLVIYLLYIWFVLQYNIDKSCKFLVYPIYFLLLIVHPVLF